MSGAPNVARLVHDHANDKVKEIESELGEDARAIAEKALEYAETVVHREVNRVFATARDGLRPAAPKIVPAENGDAGRPARAAS